MKVVRSFVLAGVLVLCGSAMGVPTPTPPAPAPATAPAGPVAGPKNAQGLTAVIVVNKDSYVLNAAQSGKDFRDQVTATQNARGGMGGRLPQPPAIDLALRITNTTGQNVTITVGGDDSQMNLTLAGPGAITADNNVPMTMEFRMGNPITIAAGKSADIKITSLAFGMRSISKYAYWTEPGDYTITAALTYGTNNKQGTVTSGPAKVKVTKE